MFTRALLLLLLLCWEQDTVWSVQLLELRMPAHANEGDVALLDCKYDLEGDELYSVKWYKGQEVFYRYVPKNTEPTKSFKTRGVNVNMERSSSTVVVLENLTKESEGEYACEVMGEAPTFFAVRKAKHIVIYLLPDNGPHVTGAKEVYHLDEQAVINCTSSASRPVAQLKWLVNDHPAAEQDVQGPWYRVAADRPDAVETTLQLRFTVEPRHFVNGAMRLKCQATIAPLYQRETNSTHYIGLPFTVNANRAPFQVGTAFGVTTDSSSKQSKAVVILFPVLSLILLLIV